MIESTNWKYNNTRNMVKVKKTNKAAFYEGFYSDNWKKRKYRHRTARQARIAQASYEDIENKLEDDV